MMPTFKSGLTIGMLVAALAMTGGCGDNDNSGNNNDNGGGARPTRTATPAAPVLTATPGVASPTPTATPGGPVITTQTVDFDFTAANGMQAFQVDAAYPAADGNFKGSAGQVDCILTGSGLLTKKDDDAGKLTLSVASTDNLTFPINIECKFEATTPITASDIVVTVQEVTQNDKPGNKDDLKFNVTVS